MMCHSAVGACMKTFITVLNYVTTFCHSGVGTHMKASCIVHSYNELHGQTTDRKSLFNLTQFLSNSDLPPYSFETVLANVVPR